MKKPLSGLLAFILCLALPAAVLAENAAADLLISAQVVAPYSVALKAPASGPLAPFVLRAGDAVTAGSTLFSVEPKAVYAEAEGTVAAVFGRPGDSADGVVNRYSSIVTIDHLQRYELKADTRTGYNSVANRNLYVGRKVYLRSINCKHFADGLITAADGYKFTVAVIGGDLVYTEDVNIYREPDYDDKVKMARTDLSVVPPAVTTASGTLLSVDVAVGDAVAVGDLLFTYVPDVLDPERRTWPDATKVIATEDLIVGDVLVSQGDSVQKDQALATAYPARGFQLMGQVEERDVGSLAIGDTFTVRFEELGLTPIDATVASISPLGTDEDTSKFTVYFNFEAPPAVMLGMHATVER